MRVCHRLTRPAVTGYRVPDGPPLSRGRPQSQAAFPPSPIIPAKAGIHFNRVCRGLTRPAVTGYRVPDGPPAFAGQAAVSDRIPAKPRHSRESGNP